ncbi:MAG: 16S rRNA (guanine(527)-N(7))-methyltransferase RsmG [Cryomorphaceae bacterium BACL21 MAG-121220-bin10]|jgi:16S rRNA (guanine527-N7)-methyltransferase|nr:MAG: 16S rRNA (guanine(527)-N(7))-methyltransferase RsmG [Cryomorphaceae bacterium BACL21 MAG-121220-bin10]|tara:strand:- start:60937 stop:61572 length:636 start_codon:yes stop_codon:yes gene_type:complete
MELIQHYFPDLSAKQIDQFGALSDLYRFWNEQINLISRKDIDLLYPRHVLHSLAIAKVQPFNDRSRILDVGTGGGFPGIPLAILYPETAFTLVDSVGKKIKVVREVAQAIGLTNVVGHHLRAEQVSGTYDFVVSRAVTKMDVFVPWVNTKIARAQHHDVPNGILYLKGGDLADELQLFPKAKITPITTFFNEEFFETKAVVYLPLGRRKKA